jgi:hypothetical protein
LLLPILTKRKQLNRRRLYYTSPRHDLTLPAAKTALEICGVDDANPRPFPTIRRDFAVLPGNRWRKEIEFL